MIVTDPPRFNTIRLIESRLNRVHIGVSRFNRVSDHKYLNYRKRCGERYIHWKKERKEKRKEKKREEGERICNEKARDQTCVCQERFSFTRLVYDPETQVRSYSEPILKELARKIESGSRGEVIYRGCANSLLVLGLDPVEKVVEAGAWSDIGSAIRSRLSPFPEKCWVVEEQNKGNYVTIEQMSGVSCVETEPRYSAPWYPNIDVALMGIQSTAQFVEKYHHIIGKIYPFN